MYFTVKIPTQYAHLTFIQHISRLKTQYEFAQHAYHVLVRYQIATASDKRVRIRSTMNRPTFPVSNRNNVKDGSFSVSGADLALVFAALPSDFLSYNVAQ